MSSSTVPSVLWRCWLGGRKGIRPVKTEWWGAGVVICLERVADCICPSWCHLMLLPLTVSCLSKIQIGFNFLVPADLGSPGNKGPLNGCVCVQWVVVSSNFHFAYLYLHIWERVVWILSSCWFILSACRLTQEFVDGTLWNVGMIGSVTTAASVVMCVQTMHGWTWARRSLTRCWLRCPADQQLRSLTCTSSPTAWRPSSTKCRVTRAPNYPGLYPIH